jgi:type I site-specific restriction-modification system R (restriction) subunit
VGSKNSSLLKHHNLRLASCFAQSLSGAERWAKSFKVEYLSKLILFREASLRRAMREYLTHFHQEQNHQGKGKVVLFPSSQEPKTCRNQSVCCRERLGCL